MAKLQFGAILIKAHMFFLQTPSLKGVEAQPIAKHIFECFEKRKGEDGKVNTQGLLSP